MMIVDGVAKGLSGDDSSGDGSGDGGDRGDGDSRDGGAGLLVVL